MEDFETVDGCMDILRGLSISQRFSRFMEYHNNLYQCEEQGDQKEAGELRILIEAVRQLDDMRETPTPEEATAYDNLCSKISKNEREISWCEKCPQDYRGRSITDLSRSNNISRAKMYEIEKRITGQ